jgi:hypothetical protein
MLHSSLFLLLVRQVVVLLIFVEHHPVLWGAGIGFSVLLKQSLLNELFLACGTRA